VTKSDRAVRLARLRSAPFTDRLVAKFDLPTGGWRGAAERRERLAAGDVERDAGEQDDGDDA
jgi:NAD+ kinase